MELTNSRYRGICAYWYAVGIADASGALDHAEDFRRFAERQAEDYYAERTGYLASIPQQWADFLARVPA